MESSLPYVVQCSFGVEHRKSLGDLASLARSPHKEVNRWQYETNVSATGRYNMSLLALHSLLLRLTPTCRSASQKCEYLMTIYQRKRVSAAL